MIDLFLLTFHGKLGTGCHLIKNLLIKIVLIEDFLLIIRDQKHIATFFNIVDFSGQR